MDIVGAEGLAVRRFRSPYVREHLEIADDFHVWESGHAFCAYDVEAVGWTRVRQQTDHVHVFGVVYFEDARVFVAGG